MSADTTTPAELAAIRERDETDWVTDVENIVPGLAQDLMQARLDRRALLTELDRIGGTDDRP